MNQPGLFPQTPLNNVSAEWVGMPEYTNVEVEEPKIIAVFKFRNEEDFEAFSAIIRKHLYGGERPFDGMQRKERKSAWYPHYPKTSNLRYCDESEIPNICDK